MQTDWKICEEYCLTCWYKAVNCATFWLIEHFWHTNTEHSGHSMREERIFFKQDENSVRNFLTFVFPNKCFGVFFFFHTIISFNSISISLESTKHQSDFIQQLKIYFNWFSFGFVEKSWINSGRLRIDRVFFVIYALHVNS